MRRALLAVLALLASAHAGAGGVRAADELGATLESRVYIEQEGRGLDVWNRSTVEAVFTFRPSGGWRVEPASIVLGPDERATVQVVGTGEDGAPVEVVFAATAPTPAGAQRTEGALTAYVWQERPWDWTPWLVGGALALLALVAASLFAARLWLRRGRRGAEDRRRWLARIEDTRNGRAPMQH